MEKVSSGEFSGAVGTSATQPMVVPPQRLHIDIPTSPTETRCAGPLDPSDEGNKTHGSARKRKSVVISSSPVMNGGLGKQMEATEIGNAISSRALLSAEDRFLENIARISKPPDNPCSIKDPHNMLCLTQGPATLCNLSKPSSVEHMSRGNIVDISSLEQPTNVDGKVKAIKGTPTAPFTPKNVLDDIRDSTTHALEQMLCDAFRDRGIRLHSLLYSVMFVIILLFFLLLWLIQQEVWNDTDVSLVQFPISTEINQMELMQQIITNMARLLRMADSPAMELVNNYICGGLGGAPVVYAAYGSVNSSLLWSRTCSAMHPDVLPPQLLPTDTVKTGMFNIAGYHSNYIITWGVLEHGDGEISTDPGYFAIILQKEQIGRLLLRNAKSSYSPLARKHISTAFLLPEFQSTKISLVLHSLNKEYENYSVVQPTKLGQLLHSTFTRVCTAGKTYTRHTVFRPGWNYSVNWDRGVNKALNAIPEPFTEYNGAWGSLSRVVMCGVVCFHQSSDICTEDNPTSVWFIADGLPLVRESKNALTLIVVVSIVAIVLFAIMTLIAYLSISVPVRHLKSLVYCAFGDKRAKTPRENLLLRYTQVLWLNDLVALVRAFQLLSFCFLLNKKYVPQHVLEKQAYELQNNKNYVWNTIVEDNMVVVEEEEETDDEGTGGDQEDMTTFVNTVSRERMQSFSKPEIFLQQSDQLRRESSSSACMLHPDTEASEGNAIIGVAHCIDAVDRGMTIVETATILAVNLCAVEMAYFTNYKVAVKQHRRIMNLLLSRIRYYRGEPFVRSGDCIAASWNAFESRADHAQRAAACAQSIVKVLALYRQAGFRVGIVLHQGPFVCGLFQDNKEAFTTVFGSVPRQAIAFAELAASLPWFSLLVTEPVKQSLSSLYECILVDAIKYHEDETSIDMFELIGELRPQHTPRSLKGTPLASPTFAQEYARVFFEFRNHEFARALDGINQLRERFPTTALQLLVRLEFLCQYYATHEEELPRPYFRPYPTWMNYEAIACVDATLDQSPQRFLDDPLLLSRLPRHMTACRSVYEDDMIGFRRELHDNVLASRRTQSNAAAAGAPEAVATRACSSSKTTPRAKSTAEKPTPISTPLENFTLPPAAMELDVIRNEELDRQEDISILNLHGTPCTQPLTDEPKQRTDDDGAENVQRTSGASGSNDVGGDNGGRSSGDTKSTVAGEPKGLESVLSLRTPTERLSDADDDDDDEQDGYELQRLSLTNRLSAAIMDRSNHTVFGLVDSFVSMKNEVIIADEPFMSVQDLEGTLDKVVYKLPTEFVAKNGITYRRSSRLLGKGSFGRVYLGIDVHSGRFVALKFLPLPSGEEEVSNIETEVTTMQKVKSSHVVEFISYAFQNDIVILVMECLITGTLQGMLVAFKNMPSSVARIFIRDVLRGLHKLHSTGIIHRDVKPQNVLMTLSGHCKISDFGASAFLQELVRKRMEGNGLQVQGTPLYLAPEAARGIPEASSDIWSCGIMFIHLVTGGLAYPKEFLQMPPEILVFQIGSGAAKPVIPDTLDEFDDEFLRHCLQVNPNDRLSAQRLLELPIFSV